MRLTPKLPFTKKMSRRGKVAHSLRIVRMYLLGTLLASTTSYRMKDSSAVEKYQQYSEKVISNAVKLRGAVTDIRRLMRDISAIVQPCGEPVGMPAMTHILPEHL